MTRQLYTLQKAGLPLLSSLNALKEQSTNPNLQSIVAQLSRDIEGGADFSSALKKYPHVFNELYVNMIQSGELSGRLAEILERLAALGEYEWRLQMRIKGALRYPAIVVSSIILGFMVLITFVIPRFAGLYSRFDTELPLPTRIMIGINYAVVHYWWLILIVIVTAGWLLKKYFATTKGSYGWDQFKLKTPVFGTLFLNIIMARFCRITGTLILQILDLVAGGVGNQVVARTIQNIRRSVNDGRGMSEPMKLSGLFPPIVTQMVAVGESTGKIDELLLHAADYYDSQIDYTVQNLVALIEPLLIFILGLAVLGMALGIFMPMWSMMRLFK
jgi:type II secretory pathway component PulF